MRRAAPLILMVLAFGVASCGGTPETGESPPAGETGQAENFDEAPPAPPMPELDLPADNDEGSAWIREHLSLYEKAYRQCEDMVDTSSPNFDPVGVNTVRAELAEDARSTSERAAWVAWVACGDGISQTPWPIPELDHLRPYP